MENVTCKGRSENVVREREACRVSDRRGKAGAAGCPRVCPHRSGHVDAIGSRPARYNGYPMRPVRSDLKHTIFGGELLKSKSVTAVAASAGSARARS